MFGINRKREQSLEGRCEQLEERCTMLLGKARELEDENHTLKVSNKKLAQTKQIEEEMIAHKLKMREEQTTLDAEKKISEAERKAAKEKDEGIAATKDTYRDKLENQLEKRGNEMKEMYSEILTRLPDVTMAITKDIKEKPSK
jgi:hypothetical protein